jgi:hypothetical protein
MHLTFGALLVVLACSASPAYAETLSPWFHLASVSRPGNLHAGVAINEVQELTVNANGGEFLLELEEAPVAVAAFDESDEELQSILETVYGEHNVEVGEAPGPVAANGLKPYLVTFTGGLAARAVALVEVAKENFGGIQLTCSASPCPSNTSVVQVVEGVFHGSEIVVTAINVGDAAANGAVTPVRIADELPPGLKAVSMEGVSGQSAASNDGPVSCEVTTLTCTFAGSLPPYHQIEVRIVVAVEPSAKTSQGKPGEGNEAGVSGGGAPAARVTHTITVSRSPTPFGVENYELTPEEAGGSPDRQAGSHPFQLTTTFDLNQLAGGFNNNLYEVEPAVLAKDLHFKLPAGLIGNPSPFAKCTLAQFFAKPSPTCPSQSILGVAVVTVQEPRGGALKTITSPLFNLEPSVGEPARFGFLPAAVPVFLDTSIRTGKDYGITVTVENVPQTIGFLSNTVTFWGIPGLAAHDGQRGYGCLEGGVCRPAEESGPPPFLALPTSCSGEPLNTEIELDSWAAPHNPLSVGATEPMGTLNGCNRLAFGSEIRIAPNLEAASTPSGLKVDVHVPQEEALNAEGLTPADVKNITVTLPEGIQLNPAAADGLQACTQTQVALNSDTEAACPNASKIATATIKTPLLPPGQYVKGFVYLASPQNFAGPLENPFGSLVAMYLVAKDPISGTLIKLPGRVSLSATGQVTATFEDNPQLPFEDAELEFFGGERAPLVTPARCGSYTTNAAFEPWTNTATDQEVLRSTATFKITTGPNGTSCPGTSLPFDPTLASETTNVNAGSFTPLSTTLSRPDGDQAIQSVTLHYPAGVSGILTGVPLCPEAQANAGTCPASSQIGETIVSVGVGGDPFTVTGGKAYLTEKYEGAPFGLSIVNPAQAGPFDLQEGRPVVVRARIEVNPSTAALTITTDPPGSPYAIPTIIDGIPLQIQHVNVLVNRPGFTFNPTNCKPTSITGSINSAEGASSPVSVPFQVTNCAALKFAPKLAVSTAGETSKAKGASLHVKLTYPTGPAGTYANITRVKVDLPKQLPSQLKTLQKACTAKQFEANPADCPAASKVGYATAVTPLLPVPLVGPAIFVSHGNEAFPSLIVVLQGYGVTLDLVGSTFISHAGITSSTFKTVPDAPVGSFELTLPQGKYAALAANLPGKANHSFCGQTLKMPTEFLAQNGAKINESTTITVTGCKAKKASKKKKKKAAKKK